MTSSVKKIITINVVIFLITLIAPGLVDFFSLKPINNGFNPIQLVTHLFLHGSPSHIILNMLGLFVFGCQLENRLGSTEFTKFYLISGIIGGLFHCITNSNPVIGASGAVFGVMALSALLYPDDLLYLYFLIPIKSKYLISSFFIFEVYLAITSNDNISHMGHIGGAITGAAYYIFYKKKI